MPKILIGLIALIIIGGGAFWFLKGASATIITEDTTYEAADVPDNLVMKGGAALTVNGAFVLDGTISCDDGALRMNVNGDLTVKGDLACEGEDAPGIMVVATGDVIFEKSATVVADGSIQIVADAADLLTTDEAIEAAYEEAGKATGEGPRFGPFVDDGSVSVVPARTIEKATVAPAFVNIAYAQDARDKDGNLIPSAVISGDWVGGDGGLPPAGVAIDTPDKKVKRIILNFDFGKDGNVTLTDFHLVGPAGRDGKSDEGKSCNARGEDGESAMRFRVQAKNIEINNFRVELGNGGAGGTAETTKECDPGVAKGGAGGEAGNMKMTAAAGIVINSMTIVPGAGGNGGGATAYGKNGVTACPGGEGGDATATAGAGGKNKKELSADGAVSGLGNITIQ